MGRIREHYKDLIRERVRHRNAIGDYSSHSDEVVLGDDDSAMRAKRARSPAAEEVTLSSREAIQLYRPFNTRELIEQDSY